MILAEEREDMKTDNSFCKTGIKISSASAPASRHGKCSSSFGECGLRLTSRSRSGCALRGSIMVWAAIRADVGSYEWYSVAVILFCILVFFIARSAEARNWGCGIGNWLEIRLHSLAVEQMKLGCISGLFVIVR